MYTVYSYLYVTMAEMNSRAQSDRTVQSTHLVPYRKSDDHYWKD